jgi:hypothetical protein
MRLPDLLFAGQIGNRPRHLEDAGVGSGGESEAVGEHLQQFLPFVIHGAEAADVAGLHLGVGVEAEADEALALDFPGPADPPPDVIK